MALLTEELLTNIFGSDVYFNKTFRSRVYYTRKVGTRFGTTAYTPLMIFTWENLYETRSGTIPGNAAALKAPRVEGVLSLTTGGISTGDDPIPAGAAGGLIKSNTYNNIT